MHLLLLLLKSVCEFALILLPLMFKQSNNGFLFSMFCVRFLSTFWCVQRNKARVFVGPCVFQIPKPLWPDSVETPTVSPTWSWWTETFQSRPLPARYFSQPTHCWLTDYWLSEWLTEWLTVDWLSDWLLTEWLTEWLTDCWLTEWLIGWLLTDWVTNWQSGWRWLSDWLDWLNEWQLTDRMTYWLLTNWVTDWLADRVTDCWLTEWLTVDWLNDWLLTDLMTYRQLTDWVTNCWLTEWLTVDWPNDLPTVDWLSDWVNE